MDFRTHCTSQPLYLNQKKVLTYCYIANTLFQKLQGLLGTDTLSLEEGLLLPRCQSVHTFFMKYPIDIYFLNRHLCVVRCLPTLRPWRISGWIWQAYYTLETAAGWGRTHHIAVGDSFQLGEGET